MSKTTTVLEIIERVTIFINNTKNGLSSLPKRPAQLLTFFVSDNNKLFRLKVFVLDRLDLVQEATGVLHPRSYGFGNVDVGWLEDHRCIAKRVREDCDL